MTILLVQSPIIKRIARAVAEVSRQDVPAATRTLVEAISFSAQRAMAEGFVYRVETSARN